LTGDNGPAVTLVHRDRPPTHLSCRSRTV